ncbi:hypothetical protein [Jiangella alkaliphila]|uniref:Uncharacterized protein n=1 Tax=Jiangella alkaliphila TaxID=419479 RepID=A0A1H2KHT0_9ACTN|nr:hypothetical protein [Jiangella alkaliphila]SDU67948.1 hypothetical protein SAMN04488563_3824 [Jiangella alkaliphila]
MRTATVPGTRKHVYVLPERPWYTATLSRPGQFHQYAASITAAAATLPAGPARDRVDEMIDFFDYLGRGCRS